MTRLLLALAMFAASGSTNANPFGEAAVVDPQTLQSVVGMADLKQITTANSIGTVRDNTINGDAVTGTITIDGQAFQNLNGLAVLNANTGNNVAINSSMQVNVAIRP